METARRSAMALALCLALAAPSWAVQNSADAFMSLPFGHIYTLWG